MKTPKSAEYRIENKQIDTIIRAYVHHLPTETAKINFVASMKCLDMAFEDYLLQESAPLLEALEEIAGIIKCEIVTRGGVNGCIIHDSSDECLAYETLTAFKQKHGVK